MGGHTLKHSERVAVPNCARANELSKPSDCVGQKRNQTDPKLKDNFLEMEQRWLMLARSYELTERLADYSEATKRQFDTLSKNT